MISVDERLKLEKDYPEVEKTKDLPSVSDFRPRYQYLYSLKGQIPNELYAYYLRRTFSMKTTDISMELLLKMFEGIDRDLLMYSDEIKQFDVLPENIVIYRGTSQKEDVPRLSWSLSRNAADEFYEGRMFRATIPKDSVIMYIPKDTTEEEVVVHVAEGFEIIEEDSVQIN